MNHKKMSLFILLGLLLVGPVWFSAVAASPSPLRWYFSSTDSPAPPPTPTATLHPTSTPTVALPTASSTPGVGHSAQTLFLQNGVGPTTAYTGTTDAIITTWSGNSYANLGGLDYLQAGESGDADQFRFLVRFELNGWLPPGAKISAAWLEIYSYDGGFDDTPQDVVVHQVSQAWVEGDGRDLFGDGRNQGVTWVTARPGATWASPGGDFAAAELDRVRVAANATGWQRWNVTAAVRSWVVRPSTNFGLLLEPDAAPWTHHEFRASEYSAAELRPRLFIVLQPPLFLPLIL